jgi:hypothetical protein
MPTSNKEQFMVYVPELNTGNWLPFEDLDEHVKSLHQQGLKPALFTTQSWDTYMGVFFKDGDPSNESLFFDVDKLNALYKSWEKE